MNAARANSKSVQRYSVLEALTQPLVSFADFPDPSVTKTRTVIFVRPKGVAPKVRVRIVWTLAYAGIAA